MYPIYTSINVIFEIMTFDCDTLNLIEMRYLSPGREQHENSYLFFDLLLCCFISRIFLCRAKQEYFFIGKI